MQRKIDDFIFNKSDKNYKLLMPLEDDCPLLNKHRFNIINYYTRKNNNKKHLVDWRICINCEHFVGQAKIHKGWPKIACSLKE